MHAVFALYGRYEWVEIFLNELKAQKLTARIHRKNPETGKDEEMKIWWRCQVRVLPGGFYEMVFPKEHIDTVLTGLGFHQKGHTDFDIEKDFSLGLFKIKPIDYLRKFLRIDPVPEFNHEKELIFEKMFVSIIPIGVRYEQGEITLKGGEFDGWNIEAL